MLLLLLVLLFIHYIIADLYRNDNRIGSIIVIDNDIEQSDDEQSDDEYQYNEYEFEQQFHDEHKKYEQNG